MSAGACKGHKGVPDPLELELQEVVGSIAWVLGTTTILQTNTTQSAPPSRLSSHG